MKAAGRVKRPSAMSAPATSSMTPPIQIWLKTAGAGLSEASPKSFWAPWSANMMPVTMRRTA